MARRWEVRKKPPRKEWESDAWLFLSQFAELRSLQWVDAKLKVRWVVPREQPDDGRDHIARFRETRHEVLESVQRDGRIKVTQPVDLPDGSKGFLVCVPIRKGEEFGGALVGVHHMGKFLDSSLGAMVPDFDIALYHGDEAFYRRSKGPEAGDPAKRETEPGAADTYIRLHAADWRLEVIPGPGLHTARGTPSSTVMLVAGIVVSFLITAMLHLGYSTQIRASEFEQANKGMAAQIAERKRAEVVLRESEERFQQIAQHLCEVPWVRSPRDQRFIYLSPSFDRVWGRPSESVSRDAETWLQTIHDEDRQRMASTLSEKGLQGGYDEEYRIVRPDGEVRWIRERAFGIRNDRGEVESIVGVSEDVTRDKRAEEKLQELEAKLADSNGDLESFILGASHDLQEPLRKILVFGDRLKALPEEQLEGEARDCLSRMHKSASRMQKIVQDLMTLSHASVQGQSFAPVGLAAVLAEVLVDLEAEIEQLGAQIHVGELPTIEADRGQIEQILRNLIANAFKFRKPGEPPAVLIESTILEADRARGAPEGKGTFCEIRVVDEGIGLEEEHWEQIFEPFKRLHGRDEYEGTGLGLTICRRIAERHGGTIRAEGKPGEGSVFIVTLPVEQSPASQIGRGKAA
jgi:PAS domain S-box-containing protein